MKKHILILFILPLTLLTRAQSYWQQQVDYSIDVTLNDADRSLDGFIRSYLLAKAAGTAA